MRKGSLKTPMKDLIQGSKNLTATKGSADMGGLMGGDDAGVSVKQIEGVSVGSPKLKTPNKDMLGGTKTASKAGATIGKSTHILHTPSTDMRRGYGK